jgi:hypothetical protein
MRSRTFGVVAALVIDAVPFVACGNGGSSDGEGSGGRDATGGERSGGSASAGRTGGTAATTGGVAPSTAGAGGTPNAPPSTGGSAVAGRGGAAAAEGGRESGAGEPGVGGMASGGTESQGGSAVAGEAATGGSIGGSASVPTEKTPTVLILLDGTGTMYEPREKGWGAVFDALVGDDGLIEEFGDRVRFGLSVFRGSVVSIPENDPQCSELHNVDFAFDNKDAIRARLELLEQDYMPGRRWDNPIGHIVTRSTEALLADPAPGTKHIVLFTDSDPNTCVIVDPQCGQDRAIHAVQEAHAAGVFSYAIGVGEMGIGNTGCDPTWARCNELFIGDMSSAGQGHPVTAPPESYLYQSCADADGRMLFADYVTSGSPLAGVIGRSAEEVTMHVRAVLERVLQIAGS